MYIHVVYLLLNSVILSRHLYNFIFRFVAVMRFDQDLVYAIVENLGQWKKAKKYLLDKL